MPKFLEDKPLLDLREDWSWLAGIFEGEGTACMSPSYSRKGGRCLDRLVMSIAQKDRQMLDEIKRITGTGSIHFSKSWEGFHWVCACRKAREILADLYPYLRTDKKRAQVRESLTMDAANREASKHKMSEFRREPNHAKVSREASEKSVRVQ